MKLYIVNKKYFDTVFPDKDENRIIHIKAFNELKNSIECNNSIPLLLTPPYDDEGIVLLDFVNKKDDTYFYEFSTTAK